MIFNSMLFLQADVNKENQGSQSMFFIFIILIFAVMYIFMILPQQKKQKKLKEMRKSLAKGDKILTQGGIFGTIADVKDDCFVVEIDKDVKIRVVKDLVYKDLSEIQKN